ncbi:sensor histidine kinase [Xylanibacillus composti]|uniref:histidine kinase n=1 Tax=Xylanibacillus composti TaxID=1572762 RepID=A0A8J4M2A2_9BACL|nr:histidine kinase [Xylanibacillus composti]MDT9723641.1 sensor histidine kinase [Xylanibacillus composti]GIQ68316.1 two-component sensor histidine kinase [Xylanibacillus composti]
MKHNQLELWIISLKVMMLLYAVVSYFMSGAVVSPWMTLFILIYVSLNISFHLIGRYLKLVMIACSIAVLVVFHYALYPLLVVLIPVNLYELAAQLFRNHWLRAAIVFIPLVVLPNEWLLDYGLFAALGFVFLTMLNIYESKVQYLSDETDRMRNDIHQLTVRLAQNEEFMRQAEHAYKLEERNRLSQEVHDQIGHSMTGALIQMEAAKRLMDNDPAKTAELLQNAIHISKEGIERIRLVLKNMKPLTEQLGLRRMKRLTEQFSATQPIRIFLTHEGNLDRIAPIHWKIFEENMMESLTNTMKYAQASVVTVHIQVLNTMIKCMVSDNGNGERQVIKGMGIIGMEERASTIGGTVIVDGSGGFSVTTLIPYKKCEESHGEG